MEINGKEMLSMLNDFRKTGKYCDVVLEIGGKKFNCHRVVLSAGVPYFDTMFGSSGCTENIKLKDIDENGLKVLVDYIYGETIEFTIRNMRLLLTIATCLKIERLIKLCIEFLKRNIDEENVLDIYVSALNSKTDLLIKYSKQFIEDHFSNVFKKKQFYELPYASLQEFISSRFTCVDSEIDVLEAVLGWVNHDTKNRNQFTIELIKNVHFQSIGPEDVAKVIKNKLIAKYFRASDGKLIQKDNKIIINAHRRYPGVLYVFGHKVINQSITQTLVTQYNGKELEKVASGNAGEIWEGWFSTCRLKNRLYVYVEFPRCKRVELSRIDTRSNTLVNIYQRGLHQSASLYNIVALDSYEVIYGGGSSRLNNSRLYCYEPETNRWDSISHVYDVKDCCLVSNNNVVYMLGGIFEVDLNQPTIRAYDHRVADTLHMINLKENCYRAAGTCIGDRIYLSGGIGMNSSQKLNTVQVYDIRADKVEIHKPMNKGRSDHSLVWYQQKLWAIGGDGQYTTEVYSPITDTWTTGFDLKPQYKKYDVKAVV